MVVIPEAGQSSDNEYKRLDRIVVACLLSASYSLLVVWCLVLAMTEFLFVLVLGFFSFFLFSSYDK